MVGLNALNGVEKFGIVVTCHCEEYVELNGDEMRRSRERALTSIISLHACGKLAHSHKMAQLFALFASFTSVFRQACLLLPRSANAV